MPNKSLKPKRNTKIRPKLKAKVTINLPPRVFRLATEWAEENERSLSALLEELLRKHLAKNGVRPDLTGEEFSALMLKKFGVVTLLPIEEKEGKDISL